MLKHIATWVSFIRIVVTWSQLLLVMRGRLPDFCINLLDSGYYFSFCWSKLGLGYYFGSYATTDAFFCLVLVLPGV